MMAMFAPSRSGNGCRFRVEQKGFFILFCSRLYIRNCPLCKTQIIFNESLTVIEEEFFETNQAPRLNRRLDQSGFDVDVLISELGERAALIGAASFAEVYS